MNEDGQVHVNNPAEQGVVYWDPEVKGNEQYTPAFGLVWKETECWKRKSLKTWRDGALSQPGIIVNNQPRANSPSKTTNILSRKKRRCQNTG